MTFLKQLKNYFCFLALILRKVSFCMSKCVKAKKMPLLPLKNNWGVTGKVVRYIFFLNFSIDSVMGNLLFHFNATTSRGQPWAQFSKAKSFMQRQRIFKVVIFLHYLHLSTNVWRRFQRWRTEQFRAGITVATAELCVHPWLTVTPCQRAANTQS